MKSKKFTIVEIMIVMTIIAVLAGIAVPAIGANRKAASEQAKEANIKTLTTASVGYLLVSPTRTIDEIDEISQLFPHLGPEQRDESVFTVNGEKVVVNDGVFSYVPVQ